MRNSVPGVQQIGKDLGSAGRGKEVVSGWWLVASLDPLNRTAWTGLNGALRRSLSIHYPLITGDCYNARYNVLLRPKLH
jgi:hypothetical protein